MMSQSRVHVLLPAPHTPIYAYTHEERKRLLKSCGCIPAGKKETENLVCRETKGVITEGFILLNRIFCSRINELAAQQMKTNKNKIHQKLLAAV